MSSPSFEQWLRSLPASPMGYRQISPVRPYAHMEEGYDQQYNRPPESLLAGEGFINLVRHLALPSEVLVEIGCGTGNLTLGYCAEEHYRVCLATDPSEAFLKITGDKITRLRAAGTIKSTAALAVLGGEDIGLLPEASASAIVLRSTLHHVLDLEAFFTHCVRVLQPGGALIFEEPCREVFVLMGFASETFLRSGNPDLKKHPKVAAQFQCFIDTIKFYVRTDVDKSEAEDKHLFTTEQLLALCNTAGLALHAWPNQAFESFTRPQPWNTPAYTFEGFFEMYVKYCMSFSDEAMSLFTRHVAPLARYVDEMLGTGQRPMMSAVFACVKRR